MVSEPIDAPLRMPDSLLSPTYDKGSRDRLLEALSQSQAKSALAECEDSCASYLKPTPGQILNRETVAHVEENGINETVPKRHAARQVTE